ncbi:Zinc finger SWIM domain-containing protein 8 [Cichlidogyrus casuarinus]|uniref:Zinc finger SWIM domain-containing protein 8 n=1 Tax=Cichlidogyrus casuarinus TaxID=1844966 RepID=A0ABD2PPJ8_9PLAT
MEERLDDSADDSFPPLKLPLPRRLPDFDSSAPETTSSGDTSPALRRKLLSNLQSGRFTRGKSDHDSSASSPPVLSRIRCTQTPTEDNSHRLQLDTTLGSPPWWEQFATGSDCPELLSEATSFHMSDLAKIISRIAGSSHRVDEEEIFVPPIGLYALGLYARTQQTTCSGAGPLATALSARPMQHASGTSSGTGGLTGSGQKNGTTSSSSAGGNAGRNLHRFWSWLSSQVVEVGWRSACSCHLTVEEINKLLDQCQTHSVTSLERGLLAVEQSMSAAPYGLVPEVHFQLASYWYDLHNKMAAEVKSCQLRHQTETHDTAPQANFVPQPHQDLSYMHQMQGLYPGYQQPYLGYDPYTQGQQAVWGQNALPPEYWPSLAGSGMMHPSHSLGNFYPQAQNVFTPYSSPEYHSTPNFLPEERQTPPQPPADEPAELRQLREQCCQVTEEGTIIRVADRDIIEGVRIRVRVGTSRITEVTSSERTTEATKATLPGWPPITECTALTLRPSGCRFCGPWI